MRKHSLFALLLAGALGLAGCPAGGGGAPAAPAAPAAPQSVTLKDFAFEPARIEVRKGKIPFAVKNAGPSDHNFTVKGVKGANTQDLKAGASQTIEVTLDKAGTYEFVCTVPGHEAAGMKGQLVVKD